MTAYSLIASEGRGYGIRATDGGTCVLDEIEDLTDNWERLENVVELFNRNRLPIACFREMAEHMIGILY